MKKELDKNDLKNIPGVGERIEKHLWNIGIYNIGDLKNQNAENLYLRDSLYKGFEDDRCLLYVYRMAIYYANNDIHEPEKLKWWNWKD